MSSIAIHGGAGVVPARLTPEWRDRYLSSLGKIRDSAHEVLAKGGTSLDAVTHAVCLLEDDPLYNAGCGAALTRDGTAELDASIMHGEQLSAGAVAAVRHIKNPILLARCVMEHSRHVLLVGEGAEEFALEHQFSWVSNHYFRTPERLAQLAKAQRGDEAGELVPGPQGTVGAVALDDAGNLAAATSTGGMTNQLSGRVGDTPLIGAGTYAKNGVCAVSCTGQGEYFIKAAAAFHIASAVEYRGLSAAAAVQEFIHGVLPALGGSGGVIVADAQGGIAMAFNSEGMFRAFHDSTGVSAVEIG